MIIHDLIFDVNILINIGNNSSISTSKIIKITAIKTNHNEKGSCAEFFGSNPPFEWGFFSRSTLIFFEIRVVNGMMVADRRMVMDDS
jgi:hypothetical protein